MQSPQFPLKGLLVQDLTDPHTPSRSLVTVAGPNALASGANFTTTKTSLFQAIDDRVQIKADMRAVGNENALAGGAESLCLELAEFPEETRDVDDGSGADQVDARR